jgi:hypothetical protein
MPDQAKFEPWWAALTVWIVVNAVNALFAQIDSAGRAGGDVPPALRCWTASSYFPACTLI